MSTIWYWDGFENPDNPNWDVWGWGAPSRVEGEGRDGAALRFTDTWGAAIFEKFPMTWGAGFVVGVSIRPVGVNNFWGIFEFGISSTNIYVNNCGLCCCNGHLMWGISDGDHIYGGQLAPAGYLGGVLRAQCWNNVEMHVFPGGYITLYVNGLYIPSVPVEFFHWDGWSLNTLALGARTQWIRTDTPTRYFDDFYYAALPEESDDPPVGDLAVVTYYPISNGSYSEWIPSDSGVDNWEMVDEHPDDADTTYVVAFEDASIGTRDTYVFGIEEHSGEPISIAPMWRARKTNIGERMLRFVAITDSAGEWVDSDVPEFHVYGWWFDNTMTLEDYNSYPRGAEWFAVDTDPDGNPWTWDSLINGEFGQEVSK